MSNIKAPEGYEFTGKQEVVGSNLVLELVPKKKEGLKLSDTPTNKINIVYKSYVIGCIIAVKGCSILNKSYLHEGYEQWLRDGMPIDTSKVKWSGSTYQIKGNILRNTDIDNGVIFDFETCGYSTNNQDPNIAKFSNGVIKQVN